MKEISWSAPEFMHYPKSPLWFGVLFGGGIILAIYFLVRKDFLAAALFLLLMIVAFYYARLKPKSILIKLDHKGITLNQMHLPYQQIKVFWIVYDPPELKTLNFETSAYFNRYLTVQLEGQDPLIIREFLLQYLPEDLDRIEPLSDKVARKLKF